MSTSSSSSSPTSRYRDTYRADELRLIASLVLRGESLGFVGIAGIGKSNLVNSVRDPKRMAAYLGAAAGSVHFACVDATTWQKTPLSLWTLMATSLEAVTPQWSFAAADSAPIPFAEEERALQRLRNRLRVVCQEKQQQVVFVLDDFDAAFEAGPLVMLEQLNSLRSDGHRGRLSYLVFSKRLPQVLGRHHNLETGCKFYDLLCQHIYALEPYTASDAHQMLTYLNDKAKRPLVHKDLAVIGGLSGGHSGLLKILFNLWSQEGCPATERDAYFAGKADVQKECERVLAGLHEAERQTAVQVAQNRPADPALVDHLARRGLVVNASPPTWFSPVMAHYLRMRSTTAQG